MVDIDEIERLLAAATPGEWDTEFDPIDAGDHATAVCLPGKAGSLGTFLAYCQHNWGEAVYNERRISWKEATSNAALIVAARNSLPAMIAEIRELRAENARLREALEREEYGHCKSIEERDYAEEYISRIYRTVTGKTAEWSNRFGFAEALDDIRAALGEPQ